MIVVLFPPYAHVFRSLICLDEALEKAARGLFFPLLSLAPLRTAHFGFNLRSLLFHGAFGPRPSSLFLSAGTLRGDTYMLIIARCTPTLLSTEIMLLIYGSGMSTSGFCSFIFSPSLPTHPPLVLFNQIPCLLLFGPLKQYMPRDQRVTVILELLKLLQLLFKKKWK